MLLHIVFQLTISLILTEGKPSQITTQKADVLYKRDDLKPFKLKVTFQNGTESTIQYNIPQSTLEMLNFTKQQFETSFVTTDKHGDYYIHLPNGEIRPIQIAYEEIIKFHNHNGNSTFSMSKSGFLKRTMKDLEEDESLKPRSPPSLHWPKFESCNIKTIRLRASPLSVNISVNDQKVFSESLSPVNQSNVIWWAGQGIAMVVINPHNCQTTFSRVFATSDFSAYRDLMWAIDKVNSGRLIILVSLRDGSLKLNSARNYLMELGFSWVKYYLFKDGWASIFTKNGRTHFEALVPNIMSTSNASSPYSFDLQLDHDDGKKENSNCENWPSGDLWDKRKLFCDSHDGFGDLCSCDNPFEFSKRDSKAPKNSTNEIPMLVIAGNRTKHLFRMIESIGKQPSVYNDLLMLSVDGDFEETFQLAEILDIKTLQHVSTGTGSAKIAANLRYGLYNIMQMFPEAKNFIVLEDDLVLSPDFYKYMHHSAPIFEMDDTIFCVSAFNHLSYPHTSKDPQRIYRVATYPAYGWMMSRKIFEEILPKFLPDEIVQDWDYFIGNSLVRKNREVLIPDVNRALHWGTQGFHIRASYYSERLYMSRTMNMEPNVKLMDISRLQKDKYEEEMEELLKNATAIEVEDIETFHISKPGTYVMFVKCMKPEDDATFKVVGENLHIWGLDKRDTHNEAWRMNLNESVLLVVGVPASKYTKYMPRNMRVTQSTKEGLEDLKNEVAFAHGTIPIITHINSTFLPNLYGDIKIYFNKMRIPINETSSGRLKTHFLEGHYFRPTVELQKNSPTDKSSMEPSETTQTHRSVIKNLKIGSTRGPELPIGPHLPGGLFPAEEEEETTTPPPQVRSHKKNVRPVQAEFDLGVDI